LCQVGAETEAPKEQRHMRTGAEFVAGDKVMVIDGALEGRIVDVKSIRGSSARVLADWMLAAREIEVPTMMLEKIQ
jgi:transcription antitermination factor NusG